MRKRILAAILAAIMLVAMLAPAMVQAKTPEITASLRSHIQVYGPIKVSSGYGRNAYTC